MFTPIFTIFTPFFVMSTPVFTVFTIVFDGASSLKSYIYINIYISSLTPGYGHNKFEVR